MRKVLILAANSAIARAVARLHVARGDALFLVGRDAAKLAATSADLGVRGGASIHTRCLDLTDIAQHDALIAEAREKMNGLDTVLIAHGVLGAQPALQASYAETAALLATNFLSPVSLLTRLANDFEKQGGGTLAVITSVAGMRGRKSNYVYGTSKGALSIFLSGLRNRLFASKVRVVDLRLGFVDTPMTAEFKKGPLWASPQAVGKSIFRAVERGTSVAYVPWFWRWVMAIITSIPERIFKRLSL